VSCIANRTPFENLHLTVCFAELHTHSTGVATFVVEKAPCFLCVRLKQRTNRSVLVRLNVLCAFFAAGQLAASLWFYIIMQNSSVVDRDALAATQWEIDRQNNFEVITNVWNLNGPIWCLGACAAVVLVTIGLTIRAVQNVNLVGAIRFLWVILWVIPLQVRRNCGDFNINAEKILSNPLLSSRRSFGPLDSLTISRSPQCG
jgi:hypothetical protein